MIPFDQKSSVSSRSILEVMRENDEGSFLGNDEECGLIFFLYKHTQPLS
jgi:hypothetical protein